MDLYCARRVGSSSVVVGILVGILVGFVCGVTILFLDLLFFPLLLASDLVEAVQGGQLQLVEVSGVSTFFGGLSWRGAGWCF